MRPEFTDDNMIEIIDGRHPMVEVLSSDPYVPNSITMGDGKARSKIITGPNMGGSVLPLKLLILSLIFSLIAKVVVSG